jgi:hypothetical protein
MKLKHLFKLENILIIVILVSLVIYFIYIYNNNNVYEYSEKIELKSKELTQTNTPRPTPSPTPRPSPRPSPRPTPSPKPRLTSSYTTNKICSSTLDECSAARNSSIGNCLVCAANKKAKENGCSDDEIDKYCKGNTTPTPQPPDNTCINKLKSDKEYPDYNNAGVIDQVYSSILSGLDYSSVYSKDLDKYKDVGISMAALQLSSGAYKEIWGKCINDAKLHPDCKDTNINEICGRFNDQIIPMVNSIISNSGDSFYNKEEIENKCNGYFDANATNDIKDITNKGIQTMQECYTTNVNNIISKSIAEASSDTENYSPDEYIINAKSACTTCSQKQAELKCDPLETIINYKNRCFDIALQNIPNKQGEIFSGPISKCENADPQLKTEIDKRIKDIYYPENEYNAATGEEAKEDLIKKYCYPQLNNICNIYNLNENPMSDPGDINGNTISDTAKELCVKNVKDYDPNKYKGDNIKAENRNKLCSTLKGSGNKDECNSVQPQGDYFMGCKFDSKTNTCNMNPVPGCMTEGMYNYHPYHTQEDGSCYSNQTKADMDIINNPDSDGMVSNCSPGDIINDVYYPRSNKPGYKCPESICRYAYCDPYKNEMLSKWRFQNQHFQPQNGNFAIKNGDLGEIIEKCRADGRKPGCDLPVKNKLNNSSVENSNNIPKCNILKKNKEPYDVARAGAFAGYPEVCGIDGCNLYSAGLRKSFVPNSVFNSDQEQQINDIRYRGGWSEYNKTTKCGGRP